MYGLVVLLPAFAIELSKAEGRAADAVAENINRIPTASAAVGIKLLMLQALIHTCTPGRRYE